MRSVGLVNRLPIIHRSGNIYLYTEDEAPEDRQASMARSADFRIATPGYLETMGIPLVAGRDIAATDSADSPGSWSSRESLAELFFPDQNPLGKKLLVDMDELIAARDRRGGRQRPPAQDHERSLPRHVHVATRRLRATENAAGRPDPQRSRAR